MLMKGIKIEQFKGNQTGIMFDINENGGLLFFVVDEAHLEQYNLGGHYDFWCTSFNETLFFAVKLGDNLWASAPYSPFMSKGYKPEFYPEGMGMNLIVVLISNADGIVKDIDFMVLGNSFSNALNLLNRDILAKGYNPVRHQMTIRAVYQKYATDEELIQQPGVKYSID